MKLTEIVSIPPSRQGPKMGEEIQPLNGFQQMMLRWEQHLPLNAMHFVELNSRPDRQHVSESLAEACRNLGLRRARVDQTGKTLIWESKLAGLANSGPSLTWETCTAAEDECVERILNRELNTPFEEGFHWPIRAVQIEQDRDSTFLGLVYHHMVTDARGISLLMREWLRRVGNQLLPGDSRPFEYTSPAREKTDAIGWRQEFAGLSRTVKDLLTLMRCRRASPDFQVSRRIHSGIHETSARLALLRGFSRVFGATVGELVLTALFEALTLMMGHRSGTKVPLALCLPVDLRSPGDESTGVYLGQMLGSLTIQDTGFVGEGFASRVGRIAVKARALKQSGRATGHSAQMRVMSRLWDLAPDWVNRRTGPALIPLAGCLSNVNFTEFMTPDVQSGLLRSYHRFSGTGPLVPLMISLTTLPSTVSLTTSHHSDVFTDGQVRRLMNHIRLRIQGELPDQSSPELFENLPVQESFGKSAEWQRSRAA